MADSAESVLKDMMAFFRRTNRCGNCNSPMAEEAFEHGRHDKEWKALNARAEKVLAKQPVGPN